MASTVPSLKLQREEQKGSAARDSRSVSVRQKIKYFMSSKGRIRLSSGSKITKRKEV